MKKSNKRAPVLFFVGYVLLVLVLLSAHMTDGILGRYGSAFSGNSAARGAKFDVKSSVASQSLEIELNFYDPKRLSDEIAIEVSSDSEVSVAYYVTVTMPSGMEYSWLDVKLKTGEQVKNSAKSENVFTFTDVGVISWQDKTPRTHTLIFEIKEAYRGMPAGAVDFSDGIVVTVCAEQVD